MSLRHHFHLFPVFLLWLIIILLPTSTRAQTDMNAPRVSMPDGWEYRWVENQDDKNGFMIEAVSDNTRLEWKKLPKLGWPPDRLRRNSFWLKTQIPPLDHWKTPSLLISESVQEFNVFVDGQHIYQHGNPAALPRNQLTGVFWHIVNLEQAMAGKPLMIQISSNSEFMGIMDQVILGNPSDHTASLILKDALLILLAGIMLATGIAMTVLYTRNLSQPFFLLIGLLALTNVVLLLTHCNIKQLLALPDVNWTAIMFMSGIISILIIGIIIEQLFGRGYKSIIRRIWQIWAVYSVWSFILAITNTYLAADETAYFILTIGTLLSWIVVLAIKSYSQNIEARIFSFGLLVSTLSIFSYHLSIVLGVRTNPFGLIHAGDLFFLGAMVLIAVRRIGGIVQELKVTSDYLSNTNTKLQEEISENLVKEGKLREYRENLEELVNQRTKQLSDTNTQLQTEINERKQEEQKRNELEKQLLQSQKMEAIGILAGGIAHDFNNILGTIIGYTEILLDSDSVDKTDKEYLKEIFRSGDRATKLVRQILLFSRVDKQNATSIRIGKLVKETLDMIRATLPRTIDIVSDIQMDCRPIMGNETQIQQIALNLFTNAGYAMKKTGGMLEITLKEINGLDHQKSTPELKDVSYVSLRIKDTGTGMTDETMEHIFEPFFSTKEIGEGSGLGLSVVHGIVKSFNGVISVESVLDVGTVFTIYFPVVHEPLDTAKPNDDRKKTGAEHILIVEDELPLAKFYDISLKKLGYDVTTSSSAIEALDLFRQEPDKFDLIFTDQTMPQMTGAQLSEEILKIRPTVPIMLATGFSHILSEKDAEKIGIRKYLLKPIKIGALSQQIRDILRKESNL